MSDLPMKVSTDDVYNKCCAFCLNQKYIETFTKKISDDKEY